MRSIQFFAAAGILATAVLAQAQVTLPYQTDFETAEGYVVGSLENQGNWSASGAGIEIVSGSGGSGVQSVSVVPAVPGRTLTLSIDATGTNGVVYVDFLGKFAVHASGQLPGLADVTPFALSAWEKISELTGELNVVDGDGSGGGVWISTGVTAPLNGNVTQEWHRYTYRIDYPAGTWDLYLDGAPVAFDVALVDPQAPLTQFTLRGSETETVGFDALNITAVNPLFADADGDGMDDAWETAQGLNPAANDRNGDADSDGLSNFQEYAAGTSANDADTDGDGMDDGWETANGMNPLDANDGQMTRVDFAVTPPLKFTATQDVNTTQFEVLDNGSTLTLWGNNWKAVDVNVPLRNDTTLRFAYTSTGNQPEISGVSLTHTLTEVAAQTFAIWGSQNFGNRTYFGYPGGGEKTYVMRPAAAIATGTYRYLGIVNDADGGQVPRVYYRGLAYGADADGDGWFNVEEFQNGTDPNNAASPATSYVEPIVDQDLDGLSDMWERIYFNNLTTADAVSDFDVDGLTDLAEQAAGTNPKKADTDGDAIPDLWEKNHGLNPLNAADGLMKTVNFNVTPPLSFNEDGQDVDSTQYAVFDQGKTLHLWGNNWKAIGANFTVTEQTTVRFTYASMGAQPEVAGVAVDNNLHSTEARVLSVWGTQPYGNRDYFGYLGHGRQAYFLRPFGRITGNTVTHIGFLNDADEGQPTRVTFSDVAYGADTDGDGWFNVEEYQNGTDPLVADAFPSTDTDGDGVQDAWEIVRGTNPYSAVDTDQDGLADDWETFYGLNPNDAADALLDPDQDGYSALQERLLDGNPWVWEDVTPPGQPGALNVEALTDTTAWLSWGPATDNNGVERYHIYQDEELVAFRLANEPEQSITLAGLTPGATHEVKVAAVDVSGNESAPVVLQVQTPAATPLPGGWAALDIGDIQQPGASRYDAGTGVWTASGSGHSYIYGEDGFHFLYKTLPANGRITMRLLDTQVAHEWVKVGLAIRATLEPGAVHGSVFASPNNGLNSQVRYRSDALSLRHPFGAQWNPAWLRLVRKQSIVEAYVSQDGVQWQWIDSFDLGLSGTVYAGVFLNGREMESPYFEGRSVTALFDNLTLEFDADQDGLYDAEEIAGGTNPGNADTDGDGFSDWVELYETFTNPLVADLQFGPAVTVGGSQTTQRVGEWIELGSGALLNDLQAGSVQYQLNAAEDKAYWLELEVANHEGVEGQWARSEVEIYVDGQFVNRLTILTEGKTYTKAGLVTPWLTAGPHDVRVALGNYFTFRRLRIAHLRLIELIGADANNNGVEDWLETRLQTLNAVEAPSTSLVSPVCLEGKVFSRAAMTVSAGGQNWQIHPAPNEGWYANVNLDPADPVDIAFSFENEGYETEKTITWEATNVIARDGERMLLRKNDSLLLAAYVNQPQGNHPVTLEIQRWSGDPAQGGSPVGSPTVVQQTAAQRHAHLFEQAGFYRITGTYQHGNGNGEGNGGEGNGNEITTGEIIVQVVEAELGADIPAWIGRARTLAVTDSAGVLVLEPDNRLAFTETTPQGGTPRSFNVATSEVEPRLIVARLGADGPILDRMQIQGFHVASSTSTYRRVIAEYPDGTRLIEMGIYLTRPVEGLEIELEFFLSGLVFENGTALLVLTAADFDANGLATVRFLSSREDAGICHTLKVYQNGELLGQR
jgi:hypothetical protein